MVVVGLGYGEIEHIRSLNVRHFLEHTHQLWEIVELGKPGLGPVARSLRGQLNGCHRFTEGGGPGVKVKQIVPLQGVVLEVFLHGIHLHHGVGDGGAGGEHNAMASSQLVQVAALHIEVAGLLGFRLTDAAHIPHFRVSGQIFVIMCFVHKETIHTQLLKGHDVIFAALVVELIQLGLQALFGALHLLDGEVVPVAPLQVTDAVQNFPQLLLQDGPLPFQRHRDFLQLGVPDDDGVIVAGGNTPAEFLAVFRLEVLFCGHENVGRRVELEVFSGPLLGQMVGDGNEGFAAQPQPLALLCGGDNLKRFPSPHYVGQQGIPTVENVGNGVHLVPPQGDFGVDAHKVQMTAIVLTGPNRVEGFIIELAKPLPALRVFPDPIGKGLFNQLLLGLSNGGFLFIEYRRLAAIGILHIVEDPHILQVEGFLDDLVAVDTVGAVGVVGLDAGTVVAFALNVPVAGHLEVMHLDVEAGIVGGVE